MELASGANGFNECRASASGVPLASSCTFVVGDSPPYPGPPFGFVDACPHDGGAPVDAGVDAPADGATDAADAAGDL